MRTVFKWVVRVLVGLLGLIVLAAIAIFIIGTIKINRTYEVAVSAVPIPSDQAAIARGQHLASAVAICTGCHGENLAGMPLLDDPIFATIYSANLTSGRGGIGAVYQDEDWVRSIRHGVDPSGKPLLVMPAHKYNVMSDEDLGALVAYIKSLAPVDNENPAPRFGPLGYVFLIAEPLFVPAALIDHSAARPVAPEMGVTAEYGEYLVSLATCSDCHGDQLNGAPGFAPLNEPPARNLTPGGELAGWTADDFIQTIRTGVNPAGHELLDPMANVAANHFSKQTDAELTAIFMYLQSLEPLEAGY